MKYLVLIILFSINKANCQRYALIDSRLKLPIIYTDSVTVEQINKGFYPVQVGSFDTLASNLNYLYNMLTVRQRAKMEKFQLRNGNAEININRVPYAYGDRYTAKVLLTAGEVKAEWLLISRFNSNKESASDIKKLISYLNSNKLLFKNPNEIEPKLYEVIVVKDY